MIASDQPSPVLGGLTPREFLRDYWQQQPLLVRGAFDDFGDPLPADELAGLACEPDVEARLVLEQGRHGPWELRHGPFEPEHFANLGDGPWSLLVQDVDKHRPDLAWVLAPFRFLPDWRIDDLMVSYAPPGGSVGPHTDAYDVFLIQGLGRRRWGIHQRPVRDVDWRDDTELRILRDFQADREWLLEPGDLLYLPPHVAHHGVALDATMTWSVGFRAPTSGDLLLPLLEQRANSQAGRKHLSDPGREPVTRPGLIDAGFLSQARQALRELLLNDDRELDRNCARQITEPKPHLLPEPPEPLEAGELERHLHAGARLLRRPQARLAWIDDGDHILLFANGLEYPLPARLTPLVEALCDDQPVGNDSPQALQLFTTLYNEGVLERWE